MNYQKSEQHLCNAKKALEKASLAIQEKKKRIICEYELNPTKCHNCNSSLLYNKRNNKFCNHSCATQYNNKFRKLTTETKQKISNKLIGRKLSEECKTKLSNLRIECCRLKYEENLKYCKVCNKVLTYDQRNKKTCSKTCQIYSTTSRTYQNGSRKTIWYFNKFVNKKICLESSWEVRVAELLDKKNIYWERPNPMEWIDKENKIHLYYPDFYLKYYDLFLDPKNPYCMKKDKEKMEYIKNKIYIIFGDIKMIEKIINELNENVV